MSQEAHVCRCHGVGDGQHRAHERADEHGTHDGLGGVRVEADRRYEHGDDENAHVGAVELRAANEALSDLWPGCAAFPHVKGTPEPCETSMDPAFVGTGCFGLLCHGRAPRFLSFMWHMMSRHTFLLSGAPRGFLCPKRGATTPIPVPKSAKDPSWGSVGDS